MKRLLAMILALLLVVSLPAYAGATPSDAQFQDSDNNFDDFDNLLASSRAFGYANFRSYVYWLDQPNNLGQTHYNSISYNSSKGYYYWYDRNAWIKSLELFFAPTNMPVKNRWYRITFRLPPAHEDFFRFVRYSSVQFRYWDPEASEWNIQSIDLTGSNTWVGSDYNLYATFYLKYNQVPQEMGWLLRISPNYNASVPEQPNEVSFLSPIVAAVLASQQEVESTSLPTFDLKSPLVSDTDAVDNIADKVEDIVGSVQQLPGKIEDVSNAVQDVVQGIANLPQNIAGALEPHYDNILQQLHHITEQLHALWDQLAAYFNDRLIPQMITDTNRIVEAIENIHLEVNVDFNALKQQLAQQHKEQMDNDNKNTEEIVNGYENGDMDSISGEFGTAAENSDNAEDQLFNEVSGNISDFTFNLEILSKYQASLDIIGTILSHFVALPFVKTPMVFMLTLSIALLMIGYYRFKGGG